MYELINERKEERINICMCVYMYMCASYMIKVCM